ncbi:hypothetical protein [Paraherbaspirillum soli]|uniref:Lipoprotein n=1 Tax=Paraherbaspirillum soli TaxID=631222 RepID=A0ABW0MHH6_9BURK
MKNKIIAAALIAVSVPCFAFNCFDSAEYKDSLSIAKEANGETGRQIGIAVEFLKENKGIDFNQALKEVTQLPPTPETVAYDNALKEVSRKIQIMKPQSAEECTDLIKLQREYEAIGKNKIQFIVNEVLGQQIEKSDSADKTDLIK